MRTRSRMRKLRDSLLGITIALTCALEVKANWEITTIDSAGVGRFSSMKIDRDGNAHVAYAVEDSAKSLKYAFWDHTLKRWFFMPIASGAQFCSLTLDSQQRPHISYVDYGTGVGARVHYTHWNGKKWLSQAIAAQDMGAKGYYTSIALDGNGYPLISFYDYAAAGGAFILRLRVYCWNGKYWEVRTVDPEYGSGKFNFIATDSTGTPHLAYGNVSAMHSSLRYARWNGESWKTEILDGVSEAVPAYSVAMVLDRNNNPHITYTNINTRIVRYAYKRGGKWQFESVDQLAKDAYPDRNGIALDDNGNPYISYYDAARGLLKLARKERDRWVTEVIDRDYTGFTSSIQIDRGAIWITYADEAGNGLKVARRALDEENAAAVFSPQQKPR
jgi:hypothetical protein